MRKKLWIVLSAVLIVAIAAGAMICLFYIHRVEKTATPSWRIQYDLGVRYLREGKYEEAVIAFKAAIEINPKRSSAYMGLADAYEAMGETGQAKKVLEDALEEANDENGLKDIKKRLEEMKGGQEGPGDPNEPGNHTAMPNVLGQSVNDAVRELEELGVKVTVEHRFDDKPFDTVVDTSFEFGDTITPEAIITVSDGPKEKLLAAVNETALGTVAYCVSQGGSVNNYWLNGDSGINLDTDGDGRTDLWVIGSPNNEEYVLAIFGSYPQYRGMECRYGNGRFDFYEAASEPGVVIEWSRGAAMYITETDWLITDEGLVQTAYHNVEVSPWGDFDGEEIARINGVETDPETYSLYMTAMRGAAITTYAPLTSAFSRDTGIDNRLIAAFGESLERLGFIGGTVSADLNGDGTDDRILWVEGFNSDEGVDIRDYSTGDRVFCPVYGETEILLLSTDSGIRVEIAEGAAGRTAARRLLFLSEVEKYEAGELLPLKDGNHFGLFDRDLLCKRTDGIYAGVDLLETVTLTNAQVDCLRVGDTIEVQQKGSILVVPVEILERHDDEYFHFIELCDNGNYYYLDWDGTEWILRTYDDMPVSRYIGSTVVLFDRNAQIYDELTFSPDRQASDIIALFDREMVSSMEKLGFQIFNGKVVWACLYYHP